MELLDILTSRPCTPSNKFYSSDSGAQRSSTPPIRTWNTSMSSLDVSLKAPPRFQTPCPTTCEPATGRLHSSIIGRGGQGLFPVGGISSSPIRPATAVLPPGGREGRALRAEALRAGQPAGSAGARAHEAAPRDELVCDLEGFWLRGLKRWAG